MITRKMAAAIEELIASQKQIAGEISRLLTMFNEDAPEKKTEEYLVMMLKELEKRWLRFSEDHQRLKATIPQEHPYIAEKLNDKTYSLYKKAVEIISNCKNKTPAKGSQTYTPQGITKNEQDSSKELDDAFCRAQNQTTVSDPSPSWQFPPQYYDANKLNNLPKLPSIKIPKFGGDYKEWKTFIDIFLNVIDNNSYLTKVEKMQYLLCHLEGDARKVISHLQLSNNNYDTALRLIQNRFNNNRKIITQYINTIIDAKRTEHRSQEDIIMLSDLIRECLEALKNLNCKTEEWGPMIVCLAMRKLDSESLRIFEESLTAPREMPSIDELLNFLEKRYQVLDYIKSSKSQRAEPANKNMRKSFHTALKRACPLCNKPHNIYQCMDFKKLSTHERNNLIRQKNLCVNCLGHPKAEKCKSNKYCLICKKRHHTLLHQNQDEHNKDHEEKQSSSVNKSKHAQHTRDTSICCASSGNGSQVLLPTAIINIKNIYGQHMQFRALIDPGSQVNLITEEAVQMLQLQKERIRASIHGVGEVESAKATSQVNIKLKLRTQESHLSIQALVLPKLNSYLPDAPIKTIDTRKYSNMVLADPDFDKPGPIDVLLGAGLYANIITNGIKIGTPTAQNTKLGWILFGSIPSAQQDTIRVSSFLSLTEIDQKLERFWEMEDSVTDTEENKCCEENFKITCSRDENGRYIVRLPFKNKDQHLGNSRNAALARLLQMEHKLRKNPSQLCEYNKFLNEYLSLGHMSLAAPYKGPEQRVYYLPHHAVFKSDSTTTKLRVVFDASCKSQSGLSLNDLLHSGPKLQQDLNNILLRWRKHRYVFTADIEKMFRQIIVAEEDRNYQRILWRPHPEGTIQEFVLNTLTYGTGPASYLSVRVLKQLAEDEGHEFPLGKRTLVSDFYVDDLLTGADSTIEAYEVQKQIISLLNRGGFNLRKWTSNSKQLLKDVPREKVEQDFFEIQEHDTIKALGILWNPQKDELQYKLKRVEPTSTLTKRILLSRIASIFDPLGLIAPVMMNAKIIMQSLWKENIDWDQEPPSNIMQAWQKLQSELHMLEEIRVPRWINYRKTQNIQLHGFCDASERGFAAVIYSRTIDTFGQIHVKLLTAKTKVAPLKQKITIPRLELNGALLLTRLLRTAIKNLEIESPRVYAWCDSEIVLAWISKNPNTLNNYVANRISEIQRLFPTSIWRHVSSNENPADIASRGTSPSILVSHDMWWRGPLWLSHEPDAWPTQKLNLTTDEDIRPSTTRVLKITTTSLELLTCSTFTRQIRVIAFCRRFIQNCRLPKTLRSLHYLTTRELEESRMCILKITQREAFPEDIERLSKNQQLARSSKIISLRPFLDNKGILRVGGRIKNSNLSEDAKHQVLLPQKHHITNILIEHAHRQTLHGGAQLTLNYIRTQYWIINAKSTVQSRIHRCIRCLRFNQNSTQPIMGDLPAIRITPSPPFSHCGIDYAGPFLTKMSKGRGTRTIKGYIALFICMVTKAVHLELVSGLSTDAFLAAYKRFVARRGRCHQIYSDNGTNFVGAKAKLDKELHEAITQASKHAAEITANDGTEWKFIPPASPHLGGIWEAGIKSVKRHLKRVLGETLLTYEEFTTVLAQVESCLNSRPIGQQSSDPTDLEPLTPGHFLIGRPLLAPPEPDITNQTLHDTWKATTKLYQHIWKRWSKEYLNLLQQRSKWVTEGKNPNIGELVIVKEDNLPPQKWAMGRITELHPGDDGVVRIVSVKYKNDIKKRPLNKLCQLPISAYNEDTESKNTSVLASFTTAKPAAPTKKRILSSLHENDKQAKADPPTKKRKVKIAPCTWASRLLHTTLLMLYWLALAFAQDYQIIYPKTGLYVEHLGQALIKRGNLRLQISFTEEELTNDQKGINSTWKKIDEMCSEAQKLTKITHCEPLFKHLTAKRKNLLQILSEIDEIMHHRIRNKRGILGHILTSVFGVNDEIYKEINLLQANQQGISQLANQQAIYLNAKINQTTFAVEDKLKKFDVRLARVISSINEMNTWYTQADHNRIGIEILSAYLSAEDYLNELEQKYAKWRNAIHGHAHLLDFISPFDIRGIIRNITEKIDSNLFISAIPQQRLEIKPENNSLRLYGYLNIIEKGTYTLLHVTPIPHLIENNTLIVADPAASTIAVNFNEQTYFNLEEKELKASITIGNHTYLCMPAIVHSIDDNPSCIIDEIYGRHSKISCETRYVHLDGIVWKALMMKNTWLFITTQPKNIAVICRGTRKEILITTTGIIRLNDDCYIKTKEITLKTAIDETIEVISSHIKEAPPAIPNIAPKQSTLKLQPGVLIRPSEHILDYSLGSNLPTSEGLHNIIALSSVSASSGILVLTILIICIIKYWSKCKELQTSCRKKQIDPQIQTKSSIEEHFNKALSSAGPSMFAREQHN